MALPLMVRRIARQGEQARATTDQVMEVGATTEVTTVCLYRLDEDHDWTRYQTKALQKKVTATRAELREFWERRAIMERCIIEAKHRVK